MYKFVEGFCYYIYQIIFLIKLFPLFDYSYIIHRFHNNCQYIFKIKFILHVNEINKEIYDEIKKDRYCNILLKDSPLDSTYFIINSKYIEPTKRYHFVINSTYKYSYKNRIKSLEDTLIINKSPIRSIFTPEIKNDCIKLYLNKDDINNLFLQGFKEINDYINIRNYCYSNNSNLDLCFCDKSSNFQEI